MSGFMVEGFGFRVLESRTLDLGLGVEGLELGVFKV